MRILFMGTGKFAVPSLDILMTSRHEVIGVVTQPDRPAGRGRKLHISPIKIRAVESDMQIFQPEKVKEQGFVDTVSQLSPTAVVVAAYGQIIPKAILDIPRYGSINVHASLLPKYRGAAPVQYALFNGDTVTGVTTMLMEPGLDTGPILLQRELAIDPEDDAESLESKLAEVGAALLIETIESLEAGTVTPISQEDAAASYAPSVKKEDCIIDWCWDADKIVNRVRGCSPRPGAFTFWQSTQLKVFAGEKVLGGESPIAEPGSVVNVGPQGIQVQTGKGVVLLVEVQPENKKRMHAGEFVRGCRMTAGCRLGM